MPFQLNRDHYVCVAEHDTTPAFRDRHPTAPAPNGPIVWEHYLTDETTSLEAMRARAARLSALGHGEVKVAKLQFIEE